MRGFTCFDQRHVSCKFSKLQYNSLAFIAGLYRATDEGSLPEIAQYSPYYLPFNVVTASKGSNLYFLFYTAEVGFELKTPRTGVMHVYHCTSPVCFDSIVLKFVGNKDMHKSSGDVVELDFRHDGCIYVIRCYPVCI